MLQIEDHITAAERFTLVVLANRVQLTRAQDRAGAYYAPAKLEATAAELVPDGPTARHAVEKLITGKRLTVVDVQRLIQLAHVADEDIADGVVYSRPASGYDGRYSALVTKLGIIAEAKSRADAEADDELGT